MAYADSLAALAQAADDGGVDYRIERPDAAQAARLGAAAADVAAHGWFASDSLPWVAEHLSLYPVAEWDARQRGYSVDARTGEPVATWDGAMLVIGDALADPVCLAADGAIHVAVHGRGRWDFRPICPDLASLYEVLARWVRYVAITRRGAIHTPDLDLDGEVVDAIAGPITAGLPAAMSANLLAFMTD